MTYTTKLGKILNKIVPESADWSVEQRQLLWENASPSSQFAAQNISIPNSSDYDFIEIYCADHVGGHPMKLCNNTYGNAGNSVNTDIGSVNVLGAGYRVFKWDISSNRVEVGNSQYKYCNESASTLRTANGNNKPVFIYGIKKLGGGN